jgi:hypothetical protein
VSCVPGCDFSHSFWSRFSLLLVQTKKRLIEREDGDGFGEEQAARVVLDMITKWIDDHLKVYDIDMAKRLNAIRPVAR